MSMIRVEDLTFSYPGSYDAIFSHVSFQMDTNWKLGLIGRNGRGKTTLLQLLMGRYEYSGTITSSVPFAYFPYSVPCPSGLLPRCWRSSAPPPRSGSSCGSCPTWR